MSDDLVEMARLAQHDERMATGALYGDLADRIKELEAQVKEDALQYLSDTGQMGETIGDLKDQLAKAIEALRITDKWLRELDMYASPDYHLVPSLQKVRDTLKELTGGKDD